MAIDRKKYRSQPYDSKPKLTADMIPTPKAVLTFQTVNEVNGMSGPTLAISFVEFPDHTYWTNKTQQDALLDAVDAGKLPDDFKRWTGKRAPFYKRENENPETNRKVMKLYATPVEKWDEELAAYDRAVAASQAQPEGRGGRARATSTR